MGSGISAVENSVSDASYDSGFVFEGNADSVDKAPTYGVIYRVACAKCREIYIGESTNGRERLKKHLVSNEDTNGFTSYVIFHLTLPLIPVPLFQQQQCCKKKQYNVG
jgi:hypothetical protein